MITSSIRKCLIKTYDKHIQAGSRFIDVISSVRDRLTDVRMTVSVPLDVNRFELVHNERSGDVILVDGFHDITYRLRLRSDRPLLVAVETLSEEKMTINYVAKSPVYRGDFVVDQNIISRLDNYGMWSKRENVYLKESNHELCMLSLNDDLVELNQRLDFKNMSVSVNHTSIRAERALYNANNPGGMYYICLNLGETCVSSISFHIIDLYEYIRGHEGLMIQIYSFTLPEYTRRGYNKFLRAVLIKLSYIMRCYDGNEIVGVVSLAENPLSAWSLVSTYDCKVVSEGGTRFQPAPNMSKEEWIRGDFANPLIVVSQSDSNLLNANDIIESFLED